MNDPLWNYKRAELVPQSGLGAGLLQKSAGLHPRPVGAGPSSQDDNVVPPRPRLRAARVGLDEVAQRVARLPNLPDRIDRRDMATAAALQPLGAVVPDLRSPSAN